MPETPASIITLNFDPKGASETKGELSEMEKITGRIGGTFEKLARNIAGLAGVAGVGAIVHDFMRMETAAVRTSLAVNNIRGGSAIMGALTGAMGNTGVDAVDLAGGVRASQLFAGGGRLRSPGAVGGYANYLGHMSQATGLDATSIGSLLGQGLSIQGRSFSQGGAQGILAQAYTQAARAGQGGMSGEFLQALLGLVQGTGFYGGGKNMRGMGAFMGAAMKGDPAFANPSVAAGATSSVMGVIQGSLGDPRMMAALQMSGSNLHDILSGNPRSAMKLAKFMDRQLGRGSTAEEAFFFSKFGPEGGRLMKDLATGKINEKDFSKGMKNLDPQQAMKTLMERASAQEHTAAAELNKLRGNVVQDVAGPLKHIEDMLASVLGIPHAGALLGGAYVGTKVGKAILRRQAGKGAAEGLAERGGAGALAKGLKLGGKVLGGPGTFAQEMLFPDKWLSDITGGDLSDGDWVTGEAKHAAEKLRHMSPKQAGKWVKKRIEHYAQGGTDDHEMRMVTILGLMLSELRKQTGGGKGPHNEGASFMGQGGAGSGMMLASFVAGGGSGPSSLFPGGAFPLPGGGGQGGTQPASYSPPGGGAGTKAGTGWKPCTLTWYDPALGGTNSGTGKKDPHAPTASGEPYEASAYTCAAPSSYAFGTVIEFAYKGKTVKCRVNDRGGAITGSHFDLSKSAGQALGVGNSRGQFRVVGSGGAKKGKKDGAHLPPGSPGVDTVRAASAGVQSGGGSDFGGMTIGGGFPEGAGGGHTTINVNVDGRRLEQHRRRTRAM